MVIAPILRKVNRGVSSAIGLAGEKYHDRKERKLDLAEQKDAQVQVNEQQDSDEPCDKLASDERIWALDETTEPPDYETSQAQRPADLDRTVSDLVHDVTSIKADLQPNALQKAHLAYPVIIPQRRPGSKARGWVRAYPPDLEEFGMDQDSFTQFLQNFENAQQASPWLKALYVAGNVIGLVPGHITLAVSLSVSIAAGTAIELQSRYKANAFLDQMNKEVFMPLGLYAMVLICKEAPVKPGEVEVGMEAVNTETAKQISKWGLPKKEGGEDEDPTQSSTKKLLRPIRLASGRTTAATMPLQIAPLIYPGLEDMIEHPQTLRDETFKDRLLRNKAFAADYFDRRARAEYAGNNPDSALTKASSDTPTFHTRFGDPNHPCNNGHLFSLVTGGKYVAQPRGSRRGRLREVGEDGKLKPKVVREPKIRGPISLITYPLKKVMTPNVLYLTIVNLPSDQEMQEARNAAGLDQRRWKEILASWREDNGAGGASLNQEGKTYQGKGPEGGVAQVSEAYLGLDMEKSEK